MFKSLFIVWFFIGIGQINYVRAGLWLGQGGYVYFISQLDLRDEKRNIKRISLKYLEVSKLYV